MSAGGTRPVWDVLVIGGGAAGLWAGGTAAARGRRTLILDKNRKAGVKILISGGTRCNLTQQGSARAIADAFGGHQSKFLYAPLSRLTPADVIRTVQDLGVPTKVEANGKVFPCSDRALDVRDALVKRLLAAGAVLRTGAAVQRLGWDPPSSRFHIALERETLEASHVILATGGLSYPGCGTTGDGYTWVSALGHQLVAPRPALTPLCCPVDWIKQLQGVTLADARVSVVTAAGGDDRRARGRLTARNGLLFTHFGLSGPAALDVSRAFCADTPGADAIRLDFLPSVTAEELTGQLTATPGRGGQSVASVLRAVLPRRVADTILALASVDAGCPLAELPRTARSQLVQAVKMNLLPIAGTLGYDKAEVTAGGVELAEVDSRTMQSRRVPGLYLAGEILDLDGPIGGYNFQAAFSTGHVAGLNA